VKLYQGVTLGAKSFETDAKGNPVKGVKRHPDIGDHVTIYAWGDDPRRHTVRSAPTRSSAATSG
jgi:hypothetical protein